MRAGPEAVGELNLDLVAREGLLGDMRPIVELQGEAGGGRETTGKGQAQREQHTLRLGGESERKALRKWNKNATEGRG